VRKLDETKEVQVKTKLTLIAGGLVAALAMPVAAQAQGGAAAGATTGAVGGAIVGGPVGAAVGGVTGAIVGGIADAQQPQFREYVVERKVPSYKYREEVRVGTVLPESGITYYDIPDQFSAPAGYRYTVVNDETVVVDPHTHRVVQVIR
jgi:hypothetical protein